jgi:hypothetical protein
MKPLSLLFSLLFLCVFSASAQDTVKNIKPDTVKTRYRPRRPKFSDIFLSPIEFQRIHRQQDSIYQKTHPEYHHPTLYVDGGLGIVLGGLRGYQANYSLNYQNGLSLFTFRGLANGSSKYDPDKFFGYETTGSSGQLALMYGLRFNDNHGSAYSFSAGIDHVNRSAYYYDSNNNRTQIEGEYIGVPFEANYQVYTRRFGVSFGIKLSGDVSRHSFFGLGVDMGLGFHTTH